MLMTIIAITALLLLVVPSIAAVGVIAWYLIQHASKRDTTGSQ